MRTVRRYYLHPPGYRAFLGAGRSDDFHAIWRDLPIARIMSFPNG